MPAGHCLGMDDRREARRSATSSSCKTTGRRSGVDAFPMNGDSIIRAGDSLRGGDCTRDALGRLCSGDPMRFAYRDGVLDAGVRATREENVHIRGTSASTGENGSGNIEGESCVMACSCPAATALEPKHDPGENPLARPLPAAPVLKRFVLGLGVGVGLGSPCPGPLTWPPLGGNCFFLRQAAPQADAAPTAPPPVESACFCNSASNGPRDPADPGTASTSKRDSSVSAVSAPRACSLVQPKAWVRKPTAWPIGMPPGALRNNSAARHALTASALRVRPSRRRAFTQSARRAQSWSPGVPSQETRRATACKAAADTAGWSLSACSTRCGQRTGP